MKRPGLLIATAGLAVLAGALAWALLGGVRLLPSYLAAWLFCLGIPLGGLAVLMALEIAGAAHAAAADPLRSTLPALPVLAVLGIPLLLRPDAIFPRHDAAFVIGTIAALVVWTLLAVLFMQRPALPGGRRGAAVLGLLLHLTIGTVAAQEWAQALDPGLGSSSFPLLLMISQCSAAVAVAALLAAISVRRAWVAPRGLAALLLALLGAWVFMQFSQFLIVWSANLPPEVAWYQHRSAGLGLPAEWAAIGACFAAVMVLLPRRFELLTTSVAWAAGAVLFAHLIEAAWLITPAFRGELAVTGADLLAFAGLGGVMAGASLLFGRWTENPIGAV